MLLWCYAVRLCQIQCCKMWFFQIVRMSPVLRLLAVCSHQLQRRWLQRLATSWLNTAIWTRSAVQSLAVLWFCSMVLPVQAAPDDFNEAKRLAVRLFSSQAEDFYCGCTIRWQGGKGIPQLRECGYQVRKNGPRAQRIEWEHVMPAQQFGHARQCWQQGGREHCGRNDSEFRRIEADLYNLRPAIGEVNGDRAHFRFAELPQTRAVHGACPVRIDFTRQLAEPRAEVRGDIARIYFYMADRYAIPLSTREETLFLRWHSADPVDDAERQLNQQLMQLMGWPNPFVSGDKIWQPGYQVNQPAPRQPAASLQPAAAKPAVAVSGRVHAAVLGNKNSRKYHLPHCPGYQQVKAANQQMFDSEQQAVAAGYSRAGNCR